MEKLLNYLREKYSYWCYIILKDKLYILLKYDVEDNEIVLSMFDDKLNYYFEKLKWLEEIFIFRDYQELPIKYEVRTSALLNLYNFANNIERVFDRFKLLYYCDNDIVKRFVEQPQQKNVWIPNLGRYIDLISWNKF